MNSIKDNKLDYKIALIIILAFVCGSLITLVINNKISTYTAQAQTKKEEFHNLINLLIEIEAGTNGGINQEEWALKIKEFSIASSKYKITTNPKEKEVVALQEIMDNMRNTLQFWRLDVPYHCSSKKPSDPCIKDYAQRAYKLFPEIAVTLEDYTSNIKKHLETESLSLMDHRGNLVSTNLSFTSWSIDRFMSLHGLEL